MSEKSCKGCKRYYKYNGVQYCDAHNIVVNLDKNQHVTFAKDCPDYISKTTKQSCVNCVHYRDFDCECLLHHFTVYEPKYSAKICFEFTPINTQKSEMNKFEKNLEMVADNLYELDNQQVSSEDLTPINKQKESCLTCDYITKDDENKLTCLKYGKDLTNISVKVTQCSDGYYPMRNKQKDPVNPSHYTQGKIECIDAIEAALTAEEFRGFLKGNVFKYMWRHENKNGLQDVKKGEWYYQRLLKVLENKDNEG